MKNITITSCVAVLTNLLISTPAFSDHQPISSLTKHPHNTVFLIKKTAGNCPKNIKAWISAHQMDGTLENTIIPDLKTTATRPRLVYRGKKTAQFVANLKKNYQSCQGEGKAKEYDYYKLKFQQGKVYFQVKLPADTPSTPSAIREAKIINSFPYVRWQIAD